MKQVIKLLEGKKTYILAIVLGIVVAMEYVGWIDSSVADTLKVLLGAGGLATLHNAVIRKG